MRRLLTFTLFSILVATSVSLKGQAIEPFVKNNVFFSPESGTYIETDILITGPSIKYVPTKKNKFEGAIEVSLIFSQNNEVVDYEKYVLKSVEIEDTNNVKLSIIDKKRFQLPPGAYTFDAKFKDLNTLDEPYQFTESVLVDFDTTKVQLSDVQLIDTYTASSEKSLFDKSGYYMVPFVINYYPSNVNKISFYSEIYNTHLLEDHEQLLVVYSIKRLHDNMIVNNLSGFKKLPVKPVNALLAEFNIEYLPSGNYYIEVQARDKNNDLLTKKQQFFQRSKPVQAFSVEDASMTVIANTFVENMSNEAIGYYVSTLKPIANASEYNIISELESSLDIEAKKRFFLNFWLTRDQLTPYETWQQYDLEVRKVNDNFSTNSLYGFETDRGRVYLQYGPPNEILPGHREPGILPYTIWKYRSTKNNQTNVKFVFYEPDLVTNYYVLIHSTAYGETYNDQWQRMLNSTFTYSSDPNDQGENIRDHYGSKINENFRE